MDSISTAMVINSNMYICSPLGGFGNHIRWMLLLSDEFSIFENKDIDQKLSFIETKVYPASRNYDNWLDFEHRFRSKLNHSKQIVFTHTDELRTLLPNEKFLYTTIDPQLALEFYQAVNPKLNGVPTAYFLESTQKHNELANSINSSNVKTISADILRQPVLSLELYKDIIGWFNLTDRYNEAQFVHKLWFDIHAQNT